MSRSLSDCDRATPSHVRNPSHKLSPPSMGIGEGFLPGLRAFPELDAPDVFIQIGPIPESTPRQITVRGQTDTEILRPRPAIPVVPAPMTATGEIGYLVVLIACPIQYLYELLIVGSISFFSNFRQLPGKTPTLESGPGFDGKSVCRHMVRIQLDNLLKCCRPNPRQGHLEC